MIRRLALVALPLALLAGALSACTESTRIPPAEPTTEVAPLFATDEEALEAATAAYEEYLVASSAVTASADLDITAIAGLVTPEYLIQEQESLEQFVKQGIRTQGASLLSSLAIQQRFESDPGRAVIVTYACVDVSGVRVLDQAGRDITPVDRPDIAALEVEFVSAESDPARLIVARSESWSGGSPCA